MSRVGMYGHLYRHHLYGHRAPVTVVRVNPYDPNEVASGSDDRTVKIWKLDTNECIQTISFEKPVMGLKWRQTTSKILVVLSNGKYISMDIESFK